MACVIFSAFASSPPAIADDTLAAATIVWNYVGELLTTQEQAGFQMSMVRMNDQLLEYWNAPCNTAYFKK